MGLCVKKKKSQYIGVLGYPFARRIKRRACPYLQASQISISSMSLLVVKLLFRFPRWLLLQSSFELVASLNVRPVFASNEPAG
jgi:hypothetical protein